MTKGACGITFEFPQLLDDLNLLKEVEVRRGVVRGVASHNNVCFTPPVGGSL